MPIGEKSNAGFSKNELKFEGIISLAISHCQRGKDRQTANHVSEVPVKPGAEEFVELAKSGNVVPVYAQLAADFETPVSAFLKLRDGKHAFLFESAESTDASGRWSIVGSQPRWVFISKGDQVTITRGAEIEQRERKGDVLDEVERLMASYKPVTHGDAPPFFGGAVG
ncbi:hypothetical protein N9067_02900, partial [Akkermansiaceae bacterium]|nr:hypothetical protein [Akkermansiaceae bacterium]